MLDLNFYKNKTVLVTGHTGFKGSWLCKMLIKFGAKVIGYSLEAPTSPNLFSLANIENTMVSIIGDVRDFKKIFNVFKKYKPECVFHLAAQSLVRESYNNPKDTYETNVLGTVNILECIRLTSSVKSFLNVTTDKVYLNNDLVDHPFKEDEPLDGYDPYSNSKSCSELVTHSYNKSFFFENSCAVSTARAGNVIGGGDFANNRIIPDCIRAILEKKDIVIRNPNSIRPYQHVLEPLYLYLLIVQKQYFDKKFADCYNIGPDDCDCMNTGELVKRFCSRWGDGLGFTIENDNGPHEASYLKLNNQKIKNVFNWKPRWHINECIGKIIDWTKVYINDKEKVSSEMDKQIDDFLKGLGEKI